MSTPSGPHCDPGSAVILAVDTAVRKDDAGFAPGTFPRKRLSGPSKQ